MVRRFGVLCLMALALAAQAQELPTLAVRPAAAVDADRVRFGDVATLAGADPELAERLGAIDIGPTPAIGAERELTREFLALRLRQANFDPRALTWTGPDRTRVTRRSVRVAGATIAQAAVDHVRKALPWPDEDLVIEVQQAPNDLELPGASAAVDFQVALAPGSRLLGPVPCTVTVSRDGRAAGRASVMLQVRVFQRLVVARQRIPTGQVVREDHVRLQRSELTALTSDGIPDLAEALGQEARHDILPLAVVTRGMLAAPRVVRRGDLVTLTAETARLRVTARAVAEQDGAVGQWIAVRNIDSEKIIYGRVRNAETVEVKF